MDALDGVAAAKPGRLLRIKDAAEDLPADARFAISRIIVVPFSVGKNGKGWMTTGGLHEFGLPELQVKEFPPNVQVPLGDAVLGVGQVMVRELFRQADHRDDRLKALTLDREITVTLDDIAEANGKPPKHKDSARGFATIGIHDKALRDGFLTIAPPAGTRIEHGEWIYRVLMDLFGMVESVENIRGDDERMEIAHRRALAELPVARKRFLDGLPVGAKLYVKHGFLVHEDEHEYMWILVNSWNGSQIDGQLSNNPRHRLDLSVGQAVGISEEDVFDWMISYPDGREEGNYTTRVLMEDQ